MHGVCYSQRKAHLPNGRCLCCSQRLHEGAAADKHGTMLVCKGAACSMVGDITPIIHTGSITSPHADCLETRLFCCGGTLLIFA